MDFSQFGKLTDWLIAVGTILLAIIAVFQDKIRSWVQSPKLELSIQTQPPDCHKTTVQCRVIVGGRLQTTAVDCYYLRLRVKNIGRQRAVWAEVFVAELLKQRANGEYERVESFLPMNLVWSHIQSPFFEAISPGMEKHCDLAHILDPANRRFGGEAENSPKLSLPSDKTILSLDLQVKPLTYSHLIGPGRYRLTLVIAAANTQPTTKVLEINVTGDWHDDEAQMLRDGIGVTIL
jgi:hypothetical protein